VPLAYDWELLRIDEESELTATIAERLAEGPALITPLQKQTKIKYYARKKERITKKRNEELDNISGKAGLNHESNKITQIKVKGK